MKICIYPNFILWSYLILQVTHIVFNFIIIFSNNSMEQSFSCERDMFSHCVILIIIVMMMMMMFCVIIIQAAGRSNSGSTRSWILCNSFCNSSPTSPESSSTSSSSPSSWLQQQQHRFYQLHHNYSLSPGDGPSLKN